MRMDVNPIDILIDLKLLNSFYIISARSYLEDSLEKIKGFGQKVFNTNFGNDKDGTGQDSQSYKNKQSLKQFEGNSGSSKLERLLKEKFNRAGVAYSDSFKTLLEDIFLGFNHKLSGCLKYLTLLKKVVDNFNKGNISDEDKNFIKIELNRINENIYEIAQKWDEILQEANVNYAEKFGKSDKTYREISSYGDDYYEKLNAMDHILSDLFSVVTPQVKTAKSHISLLTIYRLIKDIQFKL